MSDARLYLITPALSAGDLGAFAPRFEAALAAGDVASHFDVSRPAISKHLRILREAGLIEERRNGTQRLYRARAEKILEMRRFLESFWDDGLLAIKLAAEAGAEGRTER